MSLEPLYAEEFPHAEGLIYLNHAAVAPWPARTARAVEAFARENITCGASDYGSWLKTENDLRRMIAAIINAPNVDDIAFLKNTSEGISIVACGIDWKNGENVVSSDEEFPSNRIPWEAQRVHGVEFREVSLRVDDPEAALMAACDEQTRVLTISSVQYASGRRMDLDRLGDWCHEHGILFCVDAIQSIGALELDVQAINADFVMADGHKWMLGPEGIALFYSRPEAREQLELHQFGWHMVKHAGNYDNREWEPTSSAQRFECGSNNLLGIHALYASLSLLVEIGLPRVESIILGNTTYLMERLGDMPQIQLNTPLLPQQQAGIVNFTVSGVDNVGIHQELMARGVICACRGGGIRFSPHCYTSVEKIDKALQILSLTI